MSPTEDPQDPEELGTYMQFGTGGAEKRDDTAAMTPPSGDFMPKLTEPTQASFEPTRDTPGSTPPPAVGFSPFDKDVSKQNEQPERTQAYTPRTPSTPSGNYPSESLDGDTFPAVITPGLLLFGKYRTIRKLGAGGMGEVWLVLHEEAQVERALKLILPGQSFRPESRARFKQEARIGAKIKHPNSVIVHDVKIGDSVAYIEMEYLPGASLDRLLRKGEPPPLSWTLGVLEQLCSVLDVIHRPPIQTIHRDLKPSNLILLDGASHSPGCLKLCDLGIAKSLNESEAGTTASFRTGAGAMLFTPQYASPEQINLAMSAEEGDGSAGDIDHRCDIYALGVILYQLLTGFLPFDGPLQAVILRHLNETPPPFSRRNPSVRLPDGLEKLVMRCLEKDRRKRPQSAREVFDEFVRSLPADDPALTVPPTQPDYPEIWPTRSGDSTFRSGERDAYRPEEDRRGPKGKRRILTWVAAFCMIASVAGMAGFAYIWSKQRPEETGSTKVANHNSRDDSKPSIPEIAPVLAGRGFKPDPAADKVTDGLPSRITKRIGDLEVGFRLIRGGAFTIGHAPPKPEDADADALEDALPPREVTLSSFYIQEFETSNGEMQAFFDSPEFKELADLLKTSPEDLIASWTPWSPRFSERKPLELVGDPPFPVSGVRHDAAEAYAEWLGGKLPTEAQWEFAARSRGQAVLYTWDKPGKPSKDDEYVKSKAIIDSVPAVLRLVNRPENEDRTAEGVCDLIGNVREWCRDRFVPSSNPFFQGPAARDPLGPPAADPQATSEFVIRGGSFLSRSSKVSVFSPRAFSSDEDMPDLIRDLKTDKTVPELGFRTVIELTD